MSKFLTTSAQRAKLQVMSTHKIDRIQNISLRNESKPSKTPISCDRADIALLALGSSTSQTWLLHLTTNIEPLNSKYTSPAAQQTPTLHHRSPIKHSITCQKITPKHPVLELDICQKIKPKIYTPPPPQILQGGGATQKHRSTRKCHVTR